MLEYRYTCTSTKISTVTQVVKLDHVRQQQIFNILTILVADWSGNHKCVGHRGASMWNDPDVRDSHIVCAEVFIKYSFGNYSHYPQTATIYLSEFQHSSILLSSFFFGGGQAYCVARHSADIPFYLVKIDVDCHNVKESGREFCSRCVWGRTDISSFSHFKNTPALY